MKTADLQHKFFLREMDEEDWCPNKLSVSDTGKVVVLRWGLKLPVEIYETDGQFVCSFGEKLFNLLDDITTVSDGRVMVAALGCLYIFSEHGDHLNTFDLQVSCWSPNIAFHRASKRVVVAGVELEKKLLHVQIYSKDGEFVQSTQIHVKGILGLRGIIVTTEGRIGVFFFISDLFP